MSSAGCISSAPAFAPPSGVSTATLLLSAARLETKSAAPRNAWPQNFHVGGSEPVYGLTSTRGARDVATGKGYRKNIARGQSRPNSDGQLELESDKQDRSLTSGSGLSVLICEGFRKLDRVSD